MKKERNDIMKEKKGKYYVYSYYLSDKRSLFWEKS